MVFPHFNNIVDRITCSHRTGERGSDWREEAGLWRKPMLKHPFPVTSSLRGNVLAISGATPAANRTLMRSRHAGFDIYIRLAARDHTDKLTEGCAYCMLFLCLWWASAILLLLISSCFQCQHGPAKAGRINSAECKFNYQTKLFLLFDTKM